MNNLKNMQTRFYLDNRAAKTIVGCLFFGFFLMSVPLITRGSFSKLITFTGIVGGALALLYIALARGTYITIDDKGSLYGTVFFLRGKITSLSNVASIHKRSTFAGLMAEIYMKVRMKDGMLTERGLAGLGGLKENDLKKLLEMIISMNPNVEVDQDLPRK